MRQLLNFCIMLSKLDFVCDVLAELVNGNSLLLHCVTVTDSNAVVLDRIKVIGDTERSSYLVLTSVTFADRACVVIIGHKVL